MKKTIYLDNAATTPLDLRVSDIVHQTSLTCFGNSQSAHTFGWDAAHIVESARTQVKTAIGAKSEREITFTSGATESNNWVFNILLHQILNKKYPYIPEVVISAGEHASVMQSALYLESLNLISLKILPLDKFGQVTVESVIKHLNPRTSLVSIMWVQNEIGTINPIQEIAEVCFSNGVTFHTDATQALGRVPISLKNTKVTYLSASAHKIYGPKGIGLLYHNEDLVSDIPPLLKGGGHELGLRSGTLATPLIAGFGKACELIADPNVIHEEAQNISALRQFLLDGLTELFDDLKVNTCFDKSVASHLHLSWNHFKLPRVLSRLAVSRGSACSSQKTDWMSPTLVSMGLTQEQILNSIRISLGRFTTLDDIKETIGIFKNLKSRSFMSRELMG